MPQPAPKLDFTPVLRLLMRSAEVPSFKALRDLGFSKKQIQKIRRGQLQELRLETLTRLSQTLKIPLGEFLTTFSPPDSGMVLTEPTLATFAPHELKLQDKIQLLEQEYQRLQTQLQEQWGQHQQEFQQQTLQILESFLLQWPTAAHAARNNPEAPAVKLLPLARPIEQLLQAWEIEPIGEVGVDVCYDPHLHQSLTGTDIPAGAPVRIRYVGYRQREHLLYRAKVSADI